MSLWPMGHSGGTLCRAYFLAGSGRAAASRKLDLTIAYEASQGRRRGQGAACKVQKTTTSAPADRWSW